MISTIDELIIDVPIKELDIKSYANENEEFLYIERIISECEIFRDLIDDQESEFRRQINLPEVIILYQKSKESF